MPLSASLHRHLLVSAIDLETSSDLALCQDTFYSKWSCLFLLLFIPSLISVFNTDFFVACHMDNTSFAIVGNNIEMKIA